MNNKRSAAVPSSQARLWSGEAGSRRPPVPGASGPFILALHLRNDWPVQNASVVYWNAAETVAFHLFKLTFELFPGC